MLPPLNFLTLHYIYFIMMSLIWSVVFWGAAEPFRSVNYTDALFLCMSAMTGAGLNTVCLSFFFFFTLTCHQVLLLMDQLLTSTR